MAEEMKPSSLVLPHLYPLALSPKVELIAHNWLAGGLGKSGEGPMTVLSPRYPEGSTNSPICDDFASRPSRTPKDMAVLPGG